MGKKKFIYLVMLMLTAAGLSLWSTVNPGFERAAKKDMIEEPVPVENTVKNKEGNESAIIQQQKDSFTSTEDVMKLERFPSLLLVEEKSPKLKEQSYSIKNEKKIYL